MSNQGSIIHSYFKFIPLSISGSHLECKNCSKEIEFKSGGGVGSATKRLRSLRLASRSRTTILRNNPQSQKPHQHLCSSDAFISSLELERLQRSDHQLATLDHLTSTWSKKIPKTTHYQPMVNASNSGVPKKTKLMLKNYPLKWDMSCQVACWSQPTCPAHAPRSCGFPLAIAATILFTCSCYCVLLYRKVIYSHEITIECVEAKLHHENQPGLQTTHEFYVLNSVK